MNKNEFKKAVADKTGFSNADAEKAVNAVLECIGDGLVKDDEVRFAGFGSFTVKEVPERIGRNPRTGKQMVISARRVPVFKPGKNLRERVNKEK